MKRKKLKRFLKKYLTHDEMSVRADERARCVAVLDAQISRCTYHQMHPAVDAVERLKTWDKVQVIQALIGMLKEDFKDDSSFSRWEKLRKQEGRRRVADSNGNDSRGAEEMVGAEVLPGSEGRSD
jgi:hypothetical protein